MSNAVHCPISAFNALLKVLICNGTHIMLLALPGGSIWENPWSFVCCYYCLFSSLSQTVQFHSTRSKGTNSYLTTMKFTSPIDCKRTVQNWYYRGEKTTLLAKRNIIGVSNKPTTFEPDPVRVTDGSTTITCPRHIYLPGSPNIDLHGTLEQM